MLCVATFLIHLYVVAPQELSTRAARLQTQRDDLKAKLEAAEQRRASQQTVAELQQLVDRLQQDAERARTVCAVCCLCI